MEKHRSLQIWFHDVTQKNHNPTEKSAKNKPDVLTCDTGHPAWRALQSVSHAAGSRLVPL